MGTSVEAHLAYGIDLGGADHGWKFGFTAGRPSWVRDEDDQDDGEFPGPDFELAHTALLAAAGFTETDHKAPGYFDRLRTAEGQLGLRLLAYGHVDYPGWILTTETYSVHVSKAQVVDLDSGPHIAFDSRLSWACSALGITPTTEPSWLLCSDWG